jgi:hypothetical protein
MVTWAKGGGYFIGQHLELASFQKIWKRFEKASKVKLGELFFALPRALK